jgi:co-chaperonin GroES (HSP10)|tara:strand:+ start:1486 stop:2082 length:597 start_codon:yes stop_codon:yes gene_type:complete
MNSLYDYIVKPCEERYNNKKKVGDKELILNTKIEQFKIISKKAIVVSVPKAYNFPINKGDLVYIHHNVFRRFYNMKGKQQNSRSYFKEDLYFCSPDQIYLYNNGVNKAFLNRCFIKPLKSKKLGEKIIPNLGILKYGNEQLESLNLFEGDLVSFPDLRQWEFVIDNELLYCMKSKDILVKHEYKGDEEEYNTSWAVSS